MPAPEKKLTDADVMTGFNPAYGVSAEEIEANGGDVPVEDAAAEGTGETPPAESSSASPAADQVEVRLDGRTFKAPKEIAEAFTREINRRDGTRGAELQTLRQRVATLETSVHPGAKDEKDPNEPPIPNPELQIEDPAKHQEQILARIRWEQEQKVTGLTKQYEEAEAAKQQETARRAAWQAHVDAFYSKPENAVLRDNKDIVDMVLDKHRAELNDLSVEEGFERLSQLSKERLAKATGAAPALKAKAKTPPNLEGSATRVAPASQREQDSGPKSLSQAMKERRQKAAAAFTGGGGRPAAPAR